MRARTHLRNVLVTCLLQISSQYLEHEFKANVAMGRNILHTSDVFYRFYHFPYWKLSIGKWLWPRYMRLFSKRECCDFIKYDAQGTDCENEQEGDDGDCDRKYHNDEQRKKAEREEKEQEVSQGSELHDFDNDNNDDEHDMTFIEVKDCSSLRNMPRSTKFSTSGFG